MKMPCNTRFRVGFRPYQNSWPSAALTTCVRAFVAFLALSLCTRVPAQVDTSSMKPGDAMIHAYLEGKTRLIHKTFLQGIESKEQWLEKRPTYLKEYLYMLGLSPMPERTPLQPVITGTLEGDGYMVDMLHYQSSPGLYVTGNLYRPAQIKSGEKLPAILYVCGHAERGRNGNKTAYQSHGIWLARHGYICLMVDTIQRGEIKGIHHGTYRHNRWWWLSRGYTPAGVECWNGIRGIDYLIARKDVDAERIGVTGISGGGAVTFWIAAADERVKVAIPVSGMADLPGYIPNHIIDHHCDCMFLHNTFQWPWTRIAALVAPRPLLYVNSNADQIFPMEANQRVAGQLETVYSLYGAGDLVDSMVSIGGHAYREDIRKASFRFLNLHFKNDPNSVTDSEVDIVTGSRGREVHPIPPEKLRVFPRDSDIPKDERTSVIDQYFVPMAKVEAPTPGSFDSWKKRLATDLRSAAFRSFPERIPAARPKGSDTSGALRLETETGIEIRLHPTRSPEPKEQAKRIILCINASEEDYSYSGVEGDAVYICDPRGIGATQWSSRNPPNYVARSFVLLGRTVDDGRIWDIAATARYLRERYDEKIPVYVSGKGAGAVLGAYAMLLEPEIAGAILDAPFTSHMNDGCPPLLNVLRVCDLPEVLGALAPRSVSLQGVDSLVSQKVAQIYKAAGAESNLTILPAH